MIEAYQKAAAIAREEHVPVLIHVNELTQPQGHSTSGSHERYKNADRLQWEGEFDCVRQMKLWMMALDIATQEELDEMEASAKKEVLQGKKAAWEAFVNPTKAEQTEVLTLLNEVAEGSANKAFITPLINDLKGIKEPIRKDILSTARKVLRLTIGESKHKSLSDWIKNYTDKIQPKFSSHLFSDSNQTVGSVNEVLPTYDENAEEVDARLILRDNFDSIFANHPETLIFGEDAGTIGDVNQGLEGMQEKYGDLRVADAGIREATILGQGIGMAMRGL